MEWGIDWWESSIFPISTWLEVYQFQDFTFSPDLSQSIIFPVGNIDNGKNTDPHGNRFQYIQTVCCP